MSQAQDILRHLKAGHRITPINALTCYGCFRLGARIYDLRQAGHEIHADRIETSSGARVAEYRLIKKAEPKLL